MLCFAGGTILSAWLLGFLAEHPALVPGEPWNLPFATGAHDLCYLLCAVAASVAASRFLDGGRAATAVFMVLPNYAYEQVISYATGVESVYWTWPWAFSARITIMAASVALSWAAQQGRRKPASAGI
jgi:hypothetical protein